jgi:hypothetical protein
MKIPKKFKLFGTTVNVVWDNKRLNDKSVYGLSDYGKSEITLSTTQGAEELSKDRMIDTFYHERTHSILDMMHERELSANEQFVDVFSKLLRQADESAEY